MKTFYMCHRKFLPINHKWRYDKCHFNGTQELRGKTPHLFGNDVLKQLHEVQQEKEKLNGKKIPIDD